MQVEKRQQFKLEMYTYTATYIASYPTLNKSTKSSLPITWKMEAMGTLHKFTTDRTLTINSCIKETVSFVVKRKLLLLGTQHYNTSSNIREIPTLNTAVAYILTLLAENKQQVFKSKHDDSIICTYLLVSPMASVLLQLLFFCFSLLKMRF